LDVVRFALSHRITALFEFGSGHEPFSPDSFLLSISCATFLKQPNVAYTLKDSPRFGHSDDISLLMGTDDQAAEYTKGLVAAAVITIICFFFAFLLLPIFMCFGQNRVGFLSGAPLRSRATESTAH
jgi:hypothetical protein